mmetsp:Transcript_1267/g.2660  ORF Transcript_1267/g.2660 Transcript_1267/m.2660 type:complete len:116 (+) Transcript_1267:73-420(+)
MLPMRASFKFSGSSATLKALRDKPAHLPASPTSSLLSSSLLFLHLFRSLPSVVSLPFGSLFLRIALFCVAEDEVAAPKCILGVRIFRLGCFRLLCCWVSGGEGIEGGTGRLLVLK